MQAGKFSVKMSFWQENYAFIKDVYDSKAAKLMEVMDKADNAIKDVVADKIYTSEEFKKVKDVFAVGAWQHDYWTIVFLFLCSQYILSSKM